MRIKGWLEGYKTYLVLIVYSVFVLVTGRVPEGTEDSLAGIDEGAIEHALWAAAAIAAKAKWNRITKSS